jgi:beta-galactosidase
MHNLTRRDALKAGVGLAIGSALTPSVGEALDQLARAEPSRASTGAGATLPAASPRERLLLDRDWKFHFGHASDSKRDFGFGGNEAFAKDGELFPNVSERKYDDSEWNAVTLPHDWAVALPFVNDKHLRGHGYKPLGRDYPETSVGWYRRSFNLSATDSDRRISLEFDGVFRDAIVVLNGHFLGRNMSGYAPFRYDISDIANFDEPNILVIRADATEYEGWFYEGAGIYRHVWLVKTSPLYVPQWGTLVLSDLTATNGSTDSANLTISTEVANESDSAASYRVVSEVHDSSGKVIGAATTRPQRADPWSTGAITQSIRVIRPDLWSVDAPHLHTLVTRIINDRSESVDRYETTFGIRNMHFDVDNGFFLNGQRVALKGTCNHQDHAGIGSALPDAVQTFRISMLKQMGSNAYRTSHNPPTPELLDACDRLGMLVLDETRMFSSQPEGLSQLERMIRRDRNHPSVFAWSISNEEWDSQGTTAGTHVAHSMRRLAKRLDPSRPVTAAVDSSYGKGVMLSLDVQGLNYVRESIDGLHREMPKLPLFESETASAFATRGIYAKDAKRGYVSAYDINKPGYGATAEEWWTYTVARRWLAGGFAWTGFDYRGEPSPYDWPCISSHFGIMDTCGFPKDTFYYYQAWWGDKPVLHLFPHWNWAGREGQEIDVWVHSNLDSVELFLNGASLGAQTVPRQGHVSWKVQYAPGLIEARGYKDGKVVQSARRETTGPATRILLHADREWISADGEDVVMVDAQVVDDQNRPIDDADAQISFVVGGSGAIIGVGNGDPSSHEPDKATVRRLFSGKCVAIIQATRSAGALHVEATSPGLAAATTMISCRPATPRASA